MTKADRRSRCRLAWKRCGRVLSTLTGLHIKICGFPVLRAPAEPAHFTPGYHLVAPYGAQRLLASIRFGFIRHCLKPRTFSGTSSYGLKPVPFKISPGLKAHLRSGFQGPEG